MQKIERKVGNLLRSVGGNAKLSVPSNVIDIPYEYIDYVIYNYNHNAVPKETLEKVLAGYQLSIEDVSDKIVIPSDEDDDLDELVDTGQMATINTVEGFRTVIHQVF